MPAISEAITFPSATGGALSGRFDRPPADPRAYALFAHCFTCSKESIAATRVSQALAERGIATLRFDFTGLGDSDGDFADTTFASNVEDLVAATRFLAGQGKAPSLLIGHSLGGAAVIAAAPQVPEAVGICTIGAPSDPKHVEHLLTPVLETVKSQGVGEINLGGRNIRIGKGFVEDISKQSLGAVLNDLKKALLVLHAPKDEIVEIAHAGNIFKHAKHPKSFVALEGANHLLTRRADADYVAEIVAGWAARYLPKVREERLPENVLRVSSTGESRFVQQVRVGKHAFLGDEPTSVPGGLDAGPSPYDLLVAALGTCTAMTLKMYAERKKLPLEQVIVDLSHSKVHAEDCADCDTKTGKIDRIERTIRLIGDLDPATRQRLLEIADRCPVHQTLHGEVIVASQLADG